MGRKEKILNITVTTPPLPPSSSSSSSSPTPPTQTSIISKRTYTRQISNNSNSNSNSSSSSSSNHKRNENASEMLNEMENQTVDESLALGMEMIQNNSDPSNYMIASNGRTTNTVKGKQQQQQRRQSIIGKQMLVDNLNDAQATTSAPSQINSTVSSIATQRPRRQVKHKFIKSANINLVDKSNEQNNVQITDVSEQDQQQQQQQQQQPLDTLIQSLSPNCKKRLVPLLHRLPVNTAKLNWNDVISQTSSEQVEINETISMTAEEAVVASTTFSNSEDGDDNGNVKSSNCSGGAGDENGAITSTTTTTTNIECEPITSVNKEMKTERHKKLSNSKQAIRRGRQLRQTVCPVEPAECENGTEQTEHNVQTNCIEDSVLRSAFDDDEDDIMIVEDKDALDVPDHVAEEVIIEEVDDEHDNIAENPFVHYNDVVCMSPSQFNHHQNEINHELESSSFKDIPDSNASVCSKDSHDNNNGNETKNDIEPIESDTSTAATTPPYVTSINANTMPEAAMSTIAPAVIANTDECEPIYLSDSLSCFDSDSDTQQGDLDSAQHRVELTRQNADDQLPDDASDQDALNLSTDDVIIVQPEDYIEPIEVDQSDSDNEQHFASKYAFEPFVESDSQPTSDTTASKRNDRQRTHVKNKVLATTAANVITAAATSSLDDTTTDADDDSSEADRRGTRLRRDNIVRKNYSTRRTYARRHETKNENCSDDKELKNNESPLHGRHHQEVDDDRLNNCTIENEMKTTTDVMQITETGTDDECNPLDVMVTKAPPRTYVRKKGTISKLASCNSNLKSSSASTIQQNENTTNSSGNSSSSSSSNDATAKSTVTNTAALNPMIPRKRGRPRKNPIAVENNALDNNELIEEKVMIESSPKLTGSLPSAMDIENQIRTVDEINGPTEGLVEQVSAIVSFQTSNECQTKATSNDTMPIESPFKIDRRCQDICTDELNLKVSSTEINTVSVQQSQKRDKNRMKIEMTKTIMDETNDQIDRRDDEVCKKSDRTKINAMDTDLHCSASISSTTIKIEDNPESEWCGSTKAVDCTVSTTAELPISDIKIDDLNDDSVEIIEPFSVEVKHDEGVAENQVEKKTVTNVNESISEDIVCDKFTNQMQIKVEDVSTFDVEPMEVESTAAIASTHRKEEPAVVSISERIESIAIDRKPKKYAADTTPSIVDHHHQQPQQQQSTITASTNPMDDIKSGIKTEEKESPSETSEDTSIRRSGRIRTINKTKQRAQGFGLVKDKKRAPFVVDEDSSSVSFDMTTDSIQEKDTIQQIIESKPRIKSEEELEKEKIDRENGMKLFLPIIDNEYRSERTISKEAKKMTCDCFLTQSEIERGEMGCGDDCLNRMLLIECGPRCVVGDRCTNRRFQTHENSSCNIFKTEKKGYGLIATDFISPGQFIMEYVGEVLNSKQFEKRANDYSKLMNAHYYFMALSSDCVIDATKKGNISRFINHSCDPNAETQKWTVNGELRIGFFSKKPIMPDEEITFDYQFQRYGKEAQKCYCESYNCRGWIGGEPESEEELESDDDDESEEETIGKDDGDLSTESKVTSTTDDLVKKKVKTPKPKKPKDATKKPPRKERASKANRKSVTDFKKHMKRAEIMEDPDLDMEIDVLSKNGLKNQVQTLQLSRLMVRAKLQKAKVRLLSLLREGELPCRRLFLDYHGLKLMHSWMTDVNSARDSDRMLSLTFRLEILQTLEKLPITNKTALQDSKVLSTVQRWSTVNEYSFLLNDILAAANENPANNNNAAAAANDESSPSDSGSGTPILNDDAASSPKVEESSGATTPNAIASPPQSTATAAVAKESKPTSDAPSANSSNDTKSSSSSSDVLDAIPQILEQNSTIKGMGVDLLKSIISTSEKNTKIIEVAEKLPDGEMGKLVRKICLLASKLVSTWEQLPESFKIPKKLRIEQMKEHEREADESYKENVQEKSVQQKSQTFSSSGRFSERTGNNRSFDSTDSRDKDSRSETKDPRYRRSFNNNNATMSKHQRRQMFEAKVAQEEVDRKKMVENFSHESRCAFFQLDPRITRDFMVPICVNPTTGQWFGDKMLKVPTPPSHAHIQPPPVPPMPTDIHEYNIPPIDLPDQWKYAITEKGQIYYYHTKILIPQWEPPIKLLPLMEEHRINDNDLKVEPVDVPTHSTDDDHEMEHDCDDEDDDVVSILSNSTMNPNCLLELKSDPILEKYNDDDSSSDSDDSLTNELTELEAKYAYIKRKTDDYWMNMKRPPNLNEEIAAMAKSDSSGIPTMSTENHRSRDDEKLHSINSNKPNSTDSKRKRKKNRSQLVQTIRISPLSEDMKRELRRDSRRYKENKAKLRRQKELILKRKCDAKMFYADAPPRRLKKITEGLPQVSKHGGSGGSAGSSGELLGENHVPIDNHSFSVGAFLSSRYGGNESFESKRSKPSAFAPLTPGTSSSLCTSSSSLGPIASASSSSLSAVVAASGSACATAAGPSSLNTSLGALADLPSSRTAIQSSRNSLPSTSLTQSIVNKLPSIGHKFAGDTEELIMKNTIKPIKPAETVITPVTTPNINSIRSTPTQQPSASSSSSSSSSCQQLAKKQPHSILTTAKSSPKPMIKKKKTSDPNECIDSNSPAAKKIKEKFKSDISGDIVRHLKPYFSKTCTVGQIQSSDDFRHLARKLTFFVMLKELKYCNNVSLLEVTDSVKNKAREYIKKYMSKFGKTYIRDENEKDYHFEDL